MRKATNERTGEERKLLSGTIKAVFNKAAAINHVLKDE